MAKWSNIKRDGAPINPNFCPIIHEDTGEKCNKYMRAWDIDFYQRFGMCETCFVKYNDHIDKIAEEWKKQLDGEENTPVVDNVV
jgi:hypothetical protein